MQSHFSSKHGGLIVGLFIENLEKPVDLGENVAWSKIALYYFFILVTV